MEITSGVFAGKKVLDVARMGLKRALNEQGIGAKTAVGYGFKADRLCQSGPEGLPWLRLGAELSILLCL